MNAFPRLAWDHPGTVLLLDDDETFVRSLAATLEPDPVAAFTAPGSALRHLHTVAEAVGGPPFCVEATGDDAGGTEAGCEVVAVRNEPLGRFVRSPARFAMVQVAIVDQVMPAMPGTAFCRQVRKLGIKTILLSGRMNDGEAIAAFNAGAIDRYVEKNDPHVVGKLTEMVSDLRASQSRERSARFDDILSTASRGLFERHDLWSLLQQIARIFPFCEHYFHVSAPGFLLIDEHGDHRFLLVDDAEEQRRSARLIEGVEILAPERQALAEGRMVAWNLLEAVPDMQNDDARIARFFFPANRHGSLVWALIAPGLMPATGIAPDGCWRGYRDGARLVVP